MEQQRQNRVRAATDVLPRQSHVEEIPSDVLGSYTGRAFDGGRPVQDADDL